MDTMETHAPSAARGPGNLWRKRPRGIGTAPWRTLTLALGLTVGMGIAGAPAHATPATEARAVEDAFAKASQQKDNAKAIEGILDVFTDDMQHIGIFGRVHSKAELKGLLEKAFASGQKLPATVKAHEAFALDDTHLVSITHYETQAPGPDGKLGPLELRCTRVMVKQADGRWKIATEHTSPGVPLPPPAKK